MAGSNLSEEELRQAAEEAGISPQELRHALAERRGGALARSSEASSPLGPPARGVSTAHVEGRIPLERRDALDSIRRSIERQTGKRGHKQGEHEADIVDDDDGLTYRIRAAEDGTGGALVRVDIDATQGRGTQALVTTGVVGLTATLLGLGWIFGALVLWLGGLGFGALGGMMVARSIFSLRRATVSAQGIAAHALLEAEEPPAALPPVR